MALSRVDRNYTIALDKIRIFIGAIVFFTTWSVAFLNFITNFEVADRIAEARSRAMRVGLQFIGLSLGMPKYNRKRLLDALS